MDGPEIFRDLDAAIAGPLKQSTSGSSDAVGSEFLATLIEIPADLLLTTLGGTVFWGIAGLAALIYGATVTGRERLWALELASRWLTHAHAPNPPRPCDASSTMADALAADLANLQNGVATQNMAMVRSAFLFAPEEVENAFQNAAAACVAAVPER